MRNNQTLITYTLSDTQKLYVVHGDFTLDRVDAIVNAANSRLAHSSGVAGTIVCCDRNGPFCNIDRYTVDLFTSLARRERQS